MAVSSGSPVVVTARTGVAIGDLPMVALDRNPRLVSSKTWQGRPGNARANTRDARRPADPPLLPLRHSTPASSRGWGWPSSRLCPRAQTLEFFVGDYGPIGGYLIGFV